MTAQAQRVGTVLGLGSVTSGAAIVTKEITHSLTLALGVAALVAVATLVGIIFVIRAERCKELAEAYEQRRLAKRATAGILLSLLSPKQAAEMRKAALGYREVVCMYPADHKHAAPDHEHTAADHEHTAPDGPRETPSIPPQRVTNGAGGTGSSSAERRARRGAPPAS